MREGDNLADRRELLAARLDGAESRLDGRGALEVSITDLAAEIDRRPDW